MTTLEGYINRYHLGANRGLRERLDKFPLLSHKLVVFDETGGANPIRHLARDGHRTTELLTTFVCGHYFDGSAGGVDVFELIARLDSRNKSALLDYLREDT